MKQTETPLLAILKIVDVMQAKFKQIPEDQLAARQCVEMGLAAITAYQGWVNELQQEILKMDKLLKQASN